jgi:hypothetical protein
MFYVMNFYHYCWVVDMWATGMLSTYPQLEPVGPVGNDAVRNERNHYPQAGLG